MSISSFKQASLGQILVAGRPQREALRGFQAVTFLFSGVGNREALGTSAIRQPVLPAPDDRRLWSILLDLARGADVLGEVLSQCHVLNTCHMTRPGIEPGPRRCCQ
jgi:hypothetical protein